MHSVPDRYFTYLYHFYHRTSMPAKDILSVAEYRQLKSTRKKSVVIQLSPAQWKRATEGLTYSSGEPPENVRGIQLIETPGIGGGIAMPVCPAPCQIRFVNGTHDCSCTEIDTPGGGPGRGTVEYCPMSVNDSGKIGCGTGLCASGRTCRPSAWRITAKGLRLGVTVIACRCQKGGDSGGSDPLPVPVKPNLR